MPNDPSLPVGTAPHERADLIGHCASCNFEDATNLLPHNLNQNLREQVGHAVVMGTVHTLFAVDPDQRLSREQVCALTKSLSREHAAVLLDHFWFALHVPEPEGYVGVEQEWERHEATRKFVLASLKDDRVWQRYCPYAREVLETNWQSIISSGSDQDREWCIKVHVKFMSPVEEAQILGALRLAASELYEQEHDPHRAFESLVQGRSPDTMRRQYATLFARELGFQPDPEDGDSTRLDEAIDYFTRAFAHHAFWEGHRVDAVLNVIPEDEEEMSPDELLMGVDHNLTVSHFSPPVRKAPKKEPTAGASATQKPASPKPLPEPVEAGMHVSNWMGLLLLVVGILMARAGAGVRELQLKTDHDLLLAGGIICGCSLLFLGGMFKKWVFWGLIVVLLGGVLFFLHPIVTTVIQNALDGKPLGG